MKSTLIGLALASASAFSLAIAADPPARDAKPMANDAKTTNHDTKTTDAKTAQGTHDRHVTAIDQPNNQVDIDLAAAARSALVGDESLSTAAKNVTLIAADGEVILRGTVSSSQDKARVEKIVGGVAGVKHVANHIDIVAR